MWHSEELKHKQSKKQLQFMACWATISPSYRGEKECLHWGRARRAKANPDRSFPQLSTFHSPQAAENRLSPGLNHAPFFFSFPSGVQSESSQTQSIPEEPGSSGRIWLQRTRAGGGGVTWWPDLPFVRGPRLQPVPPYAAPHTHWLFPPRSWRISLCIDRRRIRSPENSARNG